MNVGELFGKSKTRLQYMPDYFWPLPTCAVGLEWEWEEAYGIHSMLGSYTAAHKGMLDFKNDGSLRGDASIEIVLATPMFGTDIRTVLDVHKSVIDRDMARIKGNGRTGFHVHLDVRDMEAPALVRFFYLYAIFERQLFDFVGKNRETSNFCVPWFRSQEPFSCIETLSDPAPIPNNVQKKFREAEQLRYSALNVHALLKFGSVEFRHMENHADELFTRQIQWIKAIMQLKRAAMEMTASPLGVIEAVQQGFDPFASDPDRFGIPMDKGIEEGLEVAHTLIPSALVPQNSKSPEEFFDFRKITGVHPARRPA